MVCPNCNQIIADGSSVCPICGAQIPSQQSNIMYGDVNNSSSTYGTNATNNQVQNAPEYTLWLTISIALIVAGCCCCCGGGITVPITGIIMLIFTILGNKAFKVRDATNYRKYFKYAKITLIAGAVLICINIIISVISGIGSMLYDYIQYM